MHCQRQACKHSPGSDPITGTGSASQLVGLYVRNPSLMEYYSFNRPRRDGWLSWPCWLTDSGRLTHKVVKRPAFSLAQDRESSPAMTGVLTTMLRKQLPSPPFPSPPQWRWGGLPGYSPTDVDIAPPIIFGTHTCTRTQLNDDGGSFFSDCGPFPVPSSLPFFYLPHPFLYLPSKNASRPYRDQDVIKMHEIILYLLEKLTKLPNFSLCLSYLPEKCPDCT